MSGGSSSLPIGITARPCAWLGAGMSCDCHEGMHLVRKKFARKTADWPRLPIARHESRLNPVRARDTSERMFAGKQVVITGGSSGVGKELARQVLARDAHVTLL